MNTVVLIGNLTKDPELKRTQSGTSTCTFTIAVSRPKSKDGKQETDFIPIVTWRQLAENCAQYLAKGRKVAVNGRIQTRNYDNKQGQKVYVTEVVADTVEFLTQKQQGDTGTATGDNAEMIPTDDECPF